MPCMGNNHATEANRPLPTTRQAAAYLGLPKGTLHRLLASREIPHIRFGAKTIRFDPGELDEWVDAHRIATERGQP